MTFKLKYWTAYKCFLIVLFAFILGWVYGLFAERRREHKKLWWHRCYSQTNCQESRLHVDHFKHCRQQGDYWLIVFLFCFHLIRFTSCDVTWRSRDMPGNLHVSLKRRSLHPHAKSRTWDSHRGRNAPCPTWPCLLLSWRPREKRGKTMAIPRLRPLYTAG